MRRLALIAGLLTAIAVVAVLALAWQLDRLVAANHDAIVAEVERLVGRPVSIANISVRVFPALSVALRDVTVGGDPRAGSEPFVHAFDVRARVTLAPLLSRRIEVARIDIHQPTVRIVRTPDGIWSYRAPDPRAPRTQLPPEAGTQALSAAFGLLIERIRVRDATVTIVDRRPDSEHRTDIERLDLTISDLQLDRSAAFELRAAMNSATPNVELAGTIGPPTTRGRWPVSAHGRAGPFAGIDATIDELQLRAIATGREVSLKHLQATLLGGHLTVTGQAGLALDAPLQVTGEVRNVSVARVLALLPTRPTRAIEGRATLRLDVAGIAGPELLRSLTGTATTEVVDGVVRDVNLFGVVLDELATWPAVGPRVTERIAPRYRTVLARPDTAVQQARASWRIAAGRAQSDDATVVADDLELRAAGWIAVDESVDVNGMIALSHELSEALVRDVRELKYITNNDGDIAVPFVVRGRLGSVTPTLDDRFLIDTLGRVLKQPPSGSLLEQLLGKNRRPATPAAGDPLKNVERQLRDLLGR